MPFLVSSSNFSSLGLALDLVGVLLLGIDLVRVQIHSIEGVNELKVRILDNQESLGFAVDDLKDTSSKLGRWISEHEYSDYHAEDEVSYNVREMRDQSKELSEHIEFITGTISDLSKALEGSAAASEQIANTSLFMAKTGLALIVAGFILQLCGSLGIEVSF